MVLNASGQKAVRGELAGTVSTQPLLQLGHPKPEKILEKDRGSGGDRGPGQPTASPWQRPALPQSLQKESKRGASVWFRGLGNAGQQRSLRSIRRDANGPWIEGLCVELPVCWSAEPAENLMANILDCSRSELCMNRLTFLSFLAIMTPHPWQESRGPGGRWGVGAEASRGETRSGR